MKNYYHVKTKEAYDSLMAFLEVQGYNWVSGSKLTAFNSWKVYKENTVICAVKESKCLTYGNFETRTQDGITYLIEWTGEPEDLIEVSREFDEWVQKAKTACSDYRDYRDDRWKEWCVWQINKMGWSHWLEEPITHKRIQDERELYPVWTTEVLRNKELYTRAILDGYTVKKEKLYEIPLPYLETSDGEAQYLSFKDKKWFASRKNTWLKQQFTELELENMVSKFYRKLAVEVGVV
ncbi:DUF1642 domain-containing protein [Enterococcus faecalis]|jgi:hypothetical protein|uniref:DUF1642 domain-containing protein n=1 Tax=Enterococcus faecalis TaxID=1351 RepID=UPI0019E04785|nr:DUF1642 domain-containing protein [Enterococcus faecalis]EGO7751991.1 DUF1642 domain-containing protein [Enterococcus faecalis]EIT2199282.1 DUF1642 domain-containing protein [Enterococcus faecalis]EKS9963156.1 DUF1642 domain-containing protein [Enterococcus faecalis]